MKKELIGTMFNNAFIKAMDGTVFNIKIGFSQKLKKKEYTKGYITRFMCNPEDSKDITNEEIRARAIKYLIDNDLIEVSIDITEEGKGVMKCN